MRVVRTRRSRLAPGHAGFHQLVLQDFRNAQQQIKRVKGTAHQPPTAASIGFKEPENGAVHPVFLMGA